jgi:hypothetical protein
MDLVRFGSAMLKPGLLKAETMALLQTPLRLASGASTDFALGWKVERVQLAGALARMVAHRAPHVPRSRRGGGRCFEHLAG